MATIFETRLIGNLGRDASIKNMDRNVIAINFPVAHNKNWRDKKTGVSKTKTTWINCTIWKKEGANLRILDFLKSGTLVELFGTPVAKGYLQEDGNIKTEIKLNVTKTNILRPTKSSHSDEEIDDPDDSSDELSDFTLHDDDF